ncbi:MAG: PAS domain-containing protein, partial [Clostridia bacterium]|nr:PAS domain-containing protein [Clostridia bacterium]
MKVLINFFKNNKRVIVLLTVLLVLLMSVLTPLVYRFFIKRTEKEAFASAEIAAAAINKNDLFSLDYDASDLEKESYKALKESLVKTVAANKPVKAAYVLVKDGEDILIASDSETPGSPLYSAPGEVLFGAGEVDLSGAENGKAVVLSPIQNAAGVWVTVVVPVFDTQGNLRAAYCNDYLASQWNDRALLNTIISLALVLMGYAVATTSLIIATLNYRLYHEKNSLLKANEEVNKHRKEIESKIIEINISEQRLSKIFNLVPTMMVMTSHLGDIYDANETFLNTLDYDKYEIVGRKLKELELFVDESFCEGCNLLVSPEQRFGNKETVIRKKSGEYLDVLISVDRIFDEQKNELVFSMIDITQRKLAEEEIKRLIKKYRTIVAVSNTGGWEYDVGNCGFYLSNEYFSMLGHVNKNEDFNVPSSLQDDWIGLLHPDDSDAAVKNFSDYIESNTDSLYENYFRMQHSDGHWLWILARGRRLRKEDGSLSEIIVGTHIDITEIKNKEEKIKYLNYHDQLTGV